MTVELVIDEPDASVVVTEVETAALVVVEAAPVEAALVSWLAAPGELGATVVVVVVVVDCVD